jgi:phospholipid/cholesterol/gamma-HCH transport system permease protein
MDLMISGAIDTFLKRKVLAVQQFINLLVDSIRQVFSPPRYVVDTLMQMDVIGFGSLPIVLLTGFFTGGVLALQSYRTLGRFGETGLMGEVVALSVVRELGPVLTAGPRLYATVITLPLLTILADFCGLLGGYFVSVYSVRLTTAEYWTSAYQALDFQDVTQGLIKPFIFAVVIALVGCHYGLHTTGGTEGVGRSTTQAVVLASVLILVLDFFVTKFLLGIKFY